MSPTTNVMKLVHKSRSNLIILISFALILLLANYLVNIKKSPTYGVRDTFVGGIYEVEDEFGVLQDTFRCRHCEDDSGSFKGAMYVIWTQGYKNDEGAFLEFEIHGEHFFDEESMAIWRDRIREHATKIRLEDGETKQADILDGYASLPSKSTFEGE